jgi:hypothetical protein
MGIIHDREAGHKIAEMRREECPVIEMVERVQALTALKGRKGFRVQCLKLGDEFFGGGALITWLIT